MTTMDWLLMDWLSMSKMTTTFTYDIACQYTRNGGEPAALPQMDGEIGEILENENTLAEAVNGEEVKD